MTNPESIIEHKDITEKVINTRAELINERFADNPEKNRPLVFRGYISEADRIKDVIKQNKYLYYLPDYEKIKQEKKRLKALSQDNNASKTIDQNNINRVLNSKYTINNEYEKRINNIQLLYKKRNDLLIKEITELKSEILNNSYNTIEIKVKDKVKNDIMKEYTDKIIIIININLIRIL